MEINAPPAAIWPWLVQMGPGRGGAYTYAWIERRLGIDIRNTDRIIPKLQDLKVGDEIPMADFLVRAAVDAQHVGPADDPGELGVVRDHQKALDPGVVHEAGGTGDGLVRRHHDGRLGHQVSGGNGGCLGEVAAMTRARGAPEPYGVPTHGRHQGFLGQQVGLGDDAYDLALVVENGKRADPVFGEQGHDVLEHGTFLTATTRVVITSRTLALISTRPSPRSP